MNSRWVALWVFTLILAFVGGQQFSQLLLTPPTLHTIEEVSASTPEQTSVSVSPSKVVSQTTILSKPSPQSTMDVSRKNDILPIEDQLFNLQLNNSTQLSLAQSVAAYSVIKDLGTDKILSLMSSFTGEDTSGASMGSLLYARLLELDPLLSLQYLTQNTQSKSFPYKASQALQQLAKSDPLQALAWYKKNIADQNLDNRGMGLSPIFESFAQNDLYGATDVILTMSQKNAQSALYGVSKVFKTPQEYSDYIRYLEGFEKPFLIKPVLRNWARNAPQDMADHLALQYPPGEVSSEHRLLLSTWSYQEPEKAANWYISTVPANQRASAVNMITNRLTDRGNHKGTLNWLMSVENVDISSAVDRLIESASYRNVDFSIANIHRVSDSDVRRVTAQRIYRALKRDDPQRAEAFKQTSEFSKILI